MNSDEKRRSQPGADKSGGAEREGLSETAIRTQLHALREDHRLGDIVRTRLSTELLNVLNGMREAVHALRKRRPDLAAELRGRGAVYEALYARPFDKLCEVRTRLLERFTAAYGDMETLAQSGRNPNEIARTALFGTHDDLMEVLRLMIDGMAELREYRSELGADLVKGGDIHDMLYAEPMQRISTIRDSMPLLINAVFGRKVI
ncbi:MAG TPA: hypothetical protein VNL72_00365 [Gammaproteobacteria bacterium]|nr:hypothetical protein [Gammaproteobacteria bacterium]